MDDRKIWAHQSFLVDNGIVWFVPYYNSILCAFDSSKEEIICSNVIDYIYDADQFINVAKLGDNIVLVPSYSDNVVLYNFEEKRIKKYEVEKIKNAKYNQATSINNKIILFPFESNTIISITQENNQLKIEERHTEVNSFIASANCGEKVYLIKKDNGIYEYDDSVQMIKQVFQGPANFIDMAKVNNNKILLLDQEGNISEFIIGELKLRKIIETQESYCDISYRNGKIYGFPEKTGDYFDVYSGEEYVNKKKISINDTLNNLEWMANAYSKAIISDGLIYVMNIIKQKLMIINEDDSVDLFGIEYPELKDDEIMKSVLSTINKKVLLENGKAGFDLKRYISIVCNLS